MIRFLFSECEDGYFGVNCVDRCNSTCKTCNKTKGTCDNGCQPGWIGANCDTRMFYCIQGNIRPHFIFAPFALVISRQIKIGLIQINTCTA